MILRWTHPISSIGRRADASSLWPTSLGRQVEPTLRTRNSHRRHASFRLYGGRMAADAIVLSVPGPHGERDVRISSPGRVLWPELGITKLDLAHYIVAVGEAFVRANGDRPVSLQRFPDGVDGEQFFSKNPPRGAPEFIRAVPV